MKHGSIVRHLSSFLAKMLWHRKLPSSVAYMRVNLIGASGNPLQRSLTGQAV